MKLGWSGAGGGGGEGGGQRHSSGLPTFQPPGNQVHCEEEGRVGREAEGGMGVQTIN